MPARFRRGQIVFSPDNRRYIVQDTEDGLVYCISNEGAETEFPESKLRAAADMGPAGAAPSRGDVYSRIKQSPVYTTLPQKLDKAGCLALLTKVERLVPGLLDFVAFTAASSSLNQSGERERVASLAIPRCREVFDQVDPAIRVTVLASQLQTTGPILISAAGLGDNLMRAMIDKGMSDSSHVFEEFRNRRRR